MEWIHYELGKWIFDVFIFAYPVIWILIFYIVGVHFLDYLILSDYWIETVEALF